ncbi:MAG: SIR2 family NAD-dependent protein deacylase [Bradymonadia bacterium]
MSLSLRNFERICFFTGAGLSAESGVPTYRGKGGMWSQYNYEEYACQEAFDRNPEKVWDFHNARREVVAGCDPNRAHRLIADIKREKPGTSIITQNIDGLLQRAGATDVIELHGSLWRVRCPCDGSKVENFDVPFVASKCSCGDDWRPDIVWFGDMLDEGTMLRAQEALAECDCIVSIGTSGVVYPAAVLPQIAVQIGATSIEINPEETAVSQLYEHCLRGPASEMLERLWNDSSA